MYPKTTLFLFLTSSSLALAQCFKPDGKKVVSDDWEPCPNVGSGHLDAICCATNRITPPGADNGNNTLLTADECLNNGLCRNRYVNPDGEEIVTYHRNFCSVSDWDSGLCFDICTANGGNGGAEMTPCDKTNPANSTRWCCGESDECCVPERNIPVHTLAAVYDGMNTSETAASASESNAPSSTPTSGGFSGGSSSNENGSENEEGGLSTGLKAGIGIGAVLGGLILVGAGIWVGLRMRKKAAVPARDEASPTPLTGELDHNQKWLYYAHEASDQNVVIELAGSREASELPGQAVAQ